MRIVAQKAPVLIVIAKIKMRAQTLVDRLKPREVSFVKTVKEYLWAKTGMKSIIEGNVLLSDPMPIRCYDHSYSLVSRRTRTSHLDSKPGCMIRLLGEDFLEKYHDIKGGLSWS